MNGQERVNRMFARQSHDRVPRHEHIWPDTLERWQSEGLDGDYDDFLDILDSDLQRTCTIRPGIYPGDPEVVEEDDETHVLRDQFGAILRHWKHKSGTPEHLGFECTGPEIWYERFKPKLLENPVQMDLEDARERDEAGRRAGRWTYFAGLESFEYTRRVIGDEVTLMAMIEDPEWVKDISRTFTDINFINFEAALDAGIRPDGIWIFGDMAFNHATVCSPQMYRELIWPDHKRLVDWTHDHGMKFIFHTDGNVNGVIDDYIDAGFDSLQPLEAKAGMDICELCPRYGDRLAFFGNINAQLMATNDIEAIEKEIAAKFAAGKATRGYMYHSDHSVPPQVSWQTYQEIIRLIDKYGSYD